MEDTLEKDVLTHFGGYEKNSLIHILNDDQELDDDFSMFKHSRYYTQDTFLDHINLQNDCFSILSLNIQSIHAKFDKMVLFLRALKQSNFEFSTICLQETWLDNNADLSLLQLENYTCISKGKQCSAHGGLIIYLHKQFGYTLKQIPNNSDIWEGLFIDISSNNNDKFITLANIYKPPKQNNNNTNIETFINEFAPFIQLLSNSRSNTIIAGDFNIDLLKINDRPVFCDFFDTLVSNSYEPKITLPTRFSNTNCTLIDNIFYKGSSNKSVEGSGVLINHISDHLPCFTTRAEIHNYNTRQRNKLCTNRTSKVFSQKCIRNHIAHVINNTPTIILDKIRSHSFKGFCQYTKNYFIDKYQLQCSILNCYICNHNTDNV